MNQNTTMHYIVYGVGNEDDHGCILYVGLSTSASRDEANISLTQVADLNADISTEYANVQEVSSCMDVFELERFSSIEHAIEGLEFWRTNFRFLGFSLLMHWAAPEISRFSEGKLYGESYQ